MISPKKICNVIDKCLEKTKSARVYTFWRELENKDKDLFSEDLFNERENESLTFFQFFGRLQNHYSHRIVIPFIYIPSFVILIFIGFLMFLCNSFGVEISLPLSVLIVFLCSLVIVICFCLVIGQKTKGYIVSENPLFYQFKVKYPEKSDEEIERIICSADWG